MAKEHIPIREPKRCIEPGCNQAAQKRERCLLHYQRFRRLAMKSGTWQPLPCGNFGDPEGHTLSAKMGGAKRAEDREGLAAAGRIGARNFAKNHPDGRHKLAQLGGRKVAEDREHMRAMAKKGAETRWGKRREGEPIDSFHAQEGGSIDSFTDVNQSFAPDTYFMQAQYDRMQQLFTRKESLSTEENAELDALIDAELDATVARTNPVA